MLWLAIILTYCTMCWLITAVAIRAPDFERPEEIRRSLAHVRRGLILLAPLFMPFVAWLYLRRQAQTFQALRWIRTLRRINRTVRELEFMPVDGSSLEEPVRGHLGTLTPPLVELGFQLIGDFRMKPEPVVRYDRILLSGDGQTLAIVCCLLKKGVVGFTSVLDDGTLVHTSGSHNPHPERTFEPTDRLSLTYCPRTHPLNLHRQHQEAIRMVAARTGARVMQLHRDQFRAVMVYDQRIFNRWRYRHGHLDREPPPRISARFEPFKAERPRSAAGAACKTCMVRPAGMTAPVGCNALVRLRSFVCPARGLTAMITTGPGVVVGNGRTSGLDDGADLLGGQAALEHVALEFEVKLGQADLPPAHVEADAHDSDHDTDQGDQGDLGDGHEPGVCGKDFEHVRTSGE
jgi:hypothetical protein